MGYGMLGLPISLSINALLVSSILVYRKKYSRNKLLLLINLLGLFWSLFWLYLYISTPVID